MESKLQWPGYLDQFFGPFIVQVKILGQHPRNNTVKTKLPTQCNILFHYFKFQMGIGKIATSGPYQYIYGNRNMFPYKLQQPKRRGKPANGKLGTQLNSVSTSFLGI